MAIHPTAVVDKQAEIHPDAEIGPYAIIEGKVTIGAGTRLHAHACVVGWTTIGENSHIYPYAVVGHEPQDLAYDGSETYCRVGDHCRIREGVTIHRGTDSGSSTVIGDHCFLMANSHVAHNCQLGGYVTMANGTLLAGHVTVGDGAFFGGNSSVHQFTRIGERVMTQGLAGIGSDIPPFFVAASGLNNCVGVNIVGLRRAGFSPEERREIQDAYKLLYRSGKPFTESVTALTGKVTTEPGKRLAAFLQAPSKRGIMASRRDAHGHA